MDPARLGLSPRFIFYVFLALFAVIFLTRFTPVEALINQTISFQGKIVVKTTGLNLVAGAPACVKAGADTCDFQVRVWNHITNSVTTSGSGNLMFTQTFQDVEIGDSNGIFKLDINSCGSTIVGNSHWGTSTGTCTVVDDSDADSDPGVSFNRADLYVEISFAPTDTPGTLGTFSEAFTRKEIQSVPSAFHAQTADNLAGLVPGNFVQLAPGAAQTTGNTTNTLININENGSGTPDLMDLLVAGTSVFNIDNAGHVGIGLSGGATATSWLSIAASTSGASQINLAAGSNPGTPLNGDLWWNGTNLNFYNGTTTVDLLAGGGVGNFVELQPASVQAASGATTLIWLNETNGGTPNLLDLQVGGTSRLILNNAGQLQLPATGLTGGLTVGGDTNLYRKAATTLATDNNFTVGDAITDIFAVLGVSDFTGNLRGVVTIANGSTTANGAGASSKTLIVASTTNFDVGNLVLVNGATYAHIDSVDSATQMTITPAITWSNANTVVEYTLPTVGDPTNVAQKFSTGYFVNGVSAGTTVFQDRKIEVTSGGGLTLITQGTSSNISLSTQSNINLNTSGGVVITKNDQDNVAGSWATGKAGGVARANGSSVVYNNKMYAWGGVVSGGGYVNSMDVYDFTTQTWNSGVAGGTAREGHVATVYNNRMYIFGGYNGGWLTSMDIYDFLTDTWTTGTTGSNHRDGVSATYDGNWYVWGGTTAASTYTNTLHIYNFAANSWSTGLAGGTGRELASGTLYNGKIYVAGGQNAGFLTALDIYDIRTNTWTTGAVTPSSRRAHSAVVFNNNLYIWGGFGVATLNTMDVYNFGKNTWSTGTAGGTARQGVESVIYDGKMYAPGGVASTTYYDILDVYDFGQRDAVLSVNVGQEERLRLDTDNVLTVSGRPLGLRYVTNDLAQSSTQGWTTGTAGGTPRTAHSGNLYNGKLYFWGGCTAVNCGTLLNTMDIYDIATDTWSTGTAGGTARFSHVSVTYNGRIYMLMGCISTVNTCTSVTNTVDIYDIATNSWTVGTAGGTARGQAGGELYNGKVFISGGYTGSGNLATTNIYDIATDSWTTGANMVAAKRQQFVSIHGNKIYHWGGFTTAAVNTNYIYDIQTNTWSTGTAGGTARRLGVVTVMNNKIYNFHGNTTVGVNTVDVYDVDRGAWITGTSAGGTARFNQAGAAYNGKFYMWGGTNTGATGVLDTVDIYNFGASGSEEVFYIANAQGVGPDDGKLFRFDATGRAYTSKQGGWFSVGADYAEYMFTKDPSLSPGELVTLDNTVKGGIKRVTKKQDENVIGVISTEPGFVGNIKDINNLVNNDPNWKLLSMVGQVMVKVSTENGEIKAGDIITSSSTPGVGMKGNPGDPHVGVAQEDFNNSEIGSIEVLVTRNNRGVNNLPEIKLTTTKDNNTLNAGIRINQEGELEYRNSNSEWKSLEERITTDSSMLWISDGDFLKIPNKVAIGNVAGLNDSSAQLTVSKTLEVRGLSVISLNSDLGEIRIGGSTIRVNPTTQEIEYRDNSNFAWVKLNSLIQGEANQRVESGWGYIQADGLNGQLSKVIGFKSAFTQIPTVTLSIAGVSETAPTSVSECQSITKQSTLQVFATSVSGFNLTWQFKEPKAGYYCYTWIGIGK